MSEQKKKKAVQAPADPVDRENASTPAESKPKKKKSPKTGAKKKETRALVPVAMPAEQPAEETPAAEPVKEEKSESRKGPEAASHGTNLPTPSVGNRLSTSTVPVYIPERERRSMWNRLVALLLLAAVVAASVLIFMIRPEKYTEKTNSIRYLYAAEKNATFVVVNGNLRGAKEGYAGSVQQEVASANGSVSAVTIDGRLYTVRGRKVVEMAGDVVDFTLSSGGDAVAWRNAQNELFYAAVGKADSAKRVNTSVTSGRYCLSPNGEELFYTYVDSDDILRINVLSNSGSKPTMPENQNLYPVAVADDCAYLYYTDAGGALYLFCRETGAKTKCGDGPTDIAFNRDFSQLIFRHNAEQSETRFFVDGARLLITDLANDPLWLVANRRVAICDTLLDGAQYMTDNLLGNYYVRSVKDAYQLVYLTRKEGQGKLDLVSPVDRADGVTVTDKFVYFINTSEGTNPRTNLYYVKTGKLQSELFYNDVKTYCTNVDGSQLLYVTSEGLFSGRVNGDHDWLSDYVLEDSLSVTSDDVFYFYYEPGVLGVSDNGDAPRRLAENVAGYMVDGDTVYYVTDVTDGGVGTVYANFRNTRKSDLLLEGVGAVN